MALHVGNAIFGPCPVCEKQQADCPVCHGLGEITFEQKVALDKDTAVAKFAADFEENVPFDID